MPARTNRTAIPLAEAIGKLEPLDDLAAVFASLGSAPRLRLLFLLYHDPDLTVGELARTLGISISGVSAHLRRLREAKLVSCRRDGQTICCTLASGSRHIRALRAMFREITRDTGCC